MKNYRWLKDLCWKEAQYILGPDDSWGPEYYDIILDVTASLEAIIKTGDLQAYDKYLHHWEDVLGCDWIVKKTQEEGELLLENLCY